MLVIYERFIEIKSLEDEINNLQITQEEKTNLMHLSADLFHHHTLEEILNRLEETDKKKFLEAVHLNQDLVMAKILKEKITGYEEILKKKLAVVRDEIINEIKAFRLGSSRDGLKK